MRVVGAWPCIAIHELCMGIKFTTHKAIIIRGHFVNSYTIKNSTGPMILKTSGVTSTVIAILKTLESTHILRLAQWYQN